MNINQTHYGSGDNIGGDKIVNFGKPRRVLNDESKGKLESLIERGNSVLIGYLSSDIETYNYALEIKNFLEGDGYIINGFNSFIVIGPPVVGVRVNRIKDGFYEIKVGNSN